MTDAELCPTARKILAALLAAPGTAHTVAEVCERIDCTVAHTRHALEILAQAGRIEGWEGSDGSVIYIART